MEPEVQPRIMSVFKIRLMTAENVDGESMRVAEIPSLVPGLSFEQSRDGNVYAVLAQSFGKALLTSKLFDEIDAYDWLEQTYTDPGYPWSEDAVKRYPQALLDLAGPKPEDGTDDSKFI